jgi:acyl carrier protein
MKQVVEVYPRVARVLAEALSLSERDMMRSATLQGDLGAESIDFLDIVFRLEREFSIKIPRDELFPESIFQHEPDLVQEGRVTEMGIGQLRMRLPYADLTEFEVDRRLTSVPKLFTVDLLVKYVEWKLAQTSIAGPSAA